MMALFNVMQSLAFAPGGFPGGAPKSTLLKLKKTTIAHNSSHIKM